MTALKTKFMINALALSIGVANYTIKGFELDNPFNDSEDVSNKLKTLGFNVIECPDCDRVTMGDKI
ncbi:caspase family protein [Pedobacter sp. MR22-3]|uniref:caspase family protein n=1 Tax=Pedobacter sp. MR22-3 TaxID=2994552 RepID=UPI0022451274|nr:caspase family protein [Pedobacter sp. MR22-3]MCX2584279.1 hypothetical protein [Pedobacter sp. MR22-3]